MTRLRKLTQWGASLVLKFSKSDVFDFNLNTGDYIKILGRKRLLQNWGSRYIIVIPKTDLKDLKLKRRDLIDIDTLKKVKNYKK